MSEELPLFYIESPEERARLLALYHPDDRAAIEAYMVEHNVTALEAIKQGGVLGRHDVAASARRALNEAPLNIIERC